MSSQARTPREEERRLSVRTLAIASASSAVAAIVTSRLWAAGTPIAAAMTPVIVTLVSEMLHRPAERLAERMTTATGAPAADADGVRIYRSRRRVLPWKLIAATAALAFVIGIAVLTLPQVVAGESLLKGNPPLYESATEGRQGSSEDETYVPAPTEDEEQPEPVAPEPTTPEEPETETETAPTTTPEEQTTPQPAPGPGTEP